MSGIVEADRPGEDPADHRLVRFEDDGADVTREGKDEQDEEIVMQSSRPKDVRTGKVRGVNILVCLDQTCEDGDGHPYIDYR